MNKNFIVKGILYLFLISMFCFWMNDLFQKSVPSEKEKFDSIVAQRLYIESVTIGRSHAAGLNYNYWSEPGINLALGGRDFASIKYILKYLLDELPNLNEVLISISYSSLYYDNYALSKGNINDARKDLYHSVPSYRIINSKDLNNYFFGKLLFFYQADHGYKFIKKRLFKKTFTINGNFNNWNDTFMDSVDIYKSAHFQALSHSKDRLIAESFNPEIIDKNVIILGDIIKLLLQYKIRVILFTPPYFRIYTDNFPREDIQEMATYIDSLADFFQIEYYNFSEDSTISSNNQYFHNADHLNLAGQEIFTKKLLHKIDN